MLRHQRGSAWRMEIKRLGSNSWPFRPGGNGAREISRHRPDAGNEKSLVVWLWRKIRHADGRLSGFSIRPQSERTFARSVAICRRDQGKKTLTQGRLDQNP